MIKNNDREATRLLCHSFNRHFKEVLSLKMSLMGMLNSNKKALSQLHNIDAEQILAAFNAQIGVMVPSELRRITIEIITSLIVDHINPKLDAVDRFELGAYIDSQIISLKDWSR